MKMESHIVLVDFGYSDWFECQDMRPFGPFESRAEAEKFATDVHGLGLMGRENDNLKPHVLRMHRPILAEVKV
jgi:hypothetical protein